MGIGVWLVSIGIVAIAGFTRGFSGFGSAMILAPALSLFFPPQQVVATVILLEMIAGASLVPAAISKTRWQEVWPLVLSAMIMVPAGAHFLSLLEPVLMRRVIGGLILGFVLLLWSGKSHYSHAHVSLTAAVGAISGFLTGLAGIGGPPIVLYSMSSNNTAAANRANFIVFFAFTQIMALISFWLSGILSITVWQLFLGFVPVFILGLLLGQFCFNRVNEAFFRQVVMALLLVFALLAIVV
jgi:uncharacterized membrane protein YfcA